MGQKTLPHREDREEKVLAGAHVRIQLLGGSSVLAEIGLQVRYNCTGHYSRPCIEVSVGRPMYAQTAINYLKHHAFRPCRGTFT